MFLVFCMCTLLQSRVKAQAVIPLYKDKAPGSEDWQWTQRDSIDRNDGTRTVWNVSHPSLTVYQAAGNVKPTDVAVIICPGGGFQTLFVDDQGNNEARWLQSQGVTAFVLSYRLIPFGLSYAAMDSMGFDHKQDLVSKLAVADGRAAITYVRGHTTQYHISPQKIGIIGYSAGGFVAAACSYQYTPENRPDFTGAFYTDYPLDLIGHIPADAPPLFIAVAENDQFGCQKFMPPLYDAWIKAGHSAQMHIYENGGHGFGMKKQGTKSDAWPEHFASWLHSIIRE